MNVQVKALTALSHDALRLARDEIGETSESTAAELKRRGLVELVADVIAPAAKEAPAPSDKLAPETMNKMAAHAKTKAGK